LLFGGICFGLMADLCDDRAIYLARVDKTLVFTLLLWLLLCRAVSIPLLGRGAVFPDVGFIFFNNVVLKFKCFNKFIFMSFADKFVEIQKKYVIREVTTINLKFTRKM